MSEGLTGWRPRARALATLLTAALLALATLRYLFPAPGEVGLDSAPGWVRWLADAADAYGLPLAVALFVGYALALRRLVPESGPPKRQRRQTGGHGFGSGSGLDLVRFGGFGVLAVILLALAVGTTARLRRITGPAMLPTIDPGERVLVRRLSPAALRRGDLVVLREGAAPTVSRLVGLPGDRLSFQGGLVTINGWAVPVCDAGVYANIVDGQEMSGRLVVEFLEDRAYLTLHRGLGERSGEYRVPPGEVFVVGDNRNVSRDARAWKAGLPLGAIEGEPWRIVGRARDGRLDLQRPLRVPGVALHLPGLDASALARGVERCLRQRPSLTRPPEPEGSLAARAPNRR